MLLPMDFEVQSVQILDFTHVIIIGFPIILGKWGGFEDSSDSENPQIRRTIDGPANKLDRKDRKQQANNGAAY